MKAPLDDEVEVDRNGIPLHGYGGCNESFHNTLLAGWPEYLGVDLWVYNYWAQGHLLEIEYCLN